MKPKATSTPKALLVSGLLLSQSLFLPLAALADNEVRIAGQTIFSVPAAGSTTADKRAETVQTNLDNALVAAKDKTPATVNITYVKGLPVITVGGYQVITVDSGTAKAQGSTPAVLAKKWADSIRNMLKDQASISSYVSQLSGDYASSAPPPINSAPAQQTSNFSTQPASQPYQPQGAPQQGYGQSYNNQAPMGASGYRQGRVTYAPAGLVIPITLAAGISTLVAKPGDVIQANVSQAVMLGDSMIPQGSTVMGTVTDATAGRMMGLSGSLGIKFNRLRTPDGIETPISAHLMGGIGKYANNGQDVAKGETWKGKVLQAGVRGAIGAGTGAALGTAVGAIAGGSRGTGRGAWSGTAIGAGVGVADSLLLRKGKDVNVPTGTAMQIQLDAPVSIAGGGGNPVAGNSPYGY